MRSIRERQEFVFRDKMEQPIRKLCLRLAIVTWYLATCVVTTSGAESTSNMLTWTGDMTAERTNAVKVIVANFDKLQPSQRATLEFQAALKDFVALRIYTDDLPSTEPCTQRSNTLLLEMDTAHRAVPLICGNEVAPIHTTRPPFKLVFIKGTTGMTLPQLNSFNISMDSLPEFPKEMYQNLKVSLMPQVLYSPLYPDIYPGSLDLTATLRATTAVLFQLRTRRARQGFCDALQLLTKDTTDFLCGQDLVTMVKEQTDAVDGQMSLHFNIEEDHVDLYELAYRSVAVDTVQCNSISTYDVKKPTVVTFGIGENEEGCEVTFLAAPTQALQFTTLSQKICGLCKNIVVEFYIGSQKMPFKKQRGYPNFGVIRAPPGKKVKIRLVYKRYTNANYIKFLVEAYEADSFPEVMNAHVRTSYIWTPGLDEHPRKTTHQVRSVQDRCVTFSVLDHQDMAPNTKPLYEHLILYSGSGEVNTFNLSRDCLGRPRPNKMIQKARYDVTTVVSQSRLPFWFIISEAGEEGKPCVTPEVPLEIKSTEELYSLFPRVTITKHMDCLFVLPQISSAPDIPASSKFRGRLAPKIGAEFYVTDGPDPSSHTLTDFGQYSDITAWVYPKDKIYVYFRTQFDVTADGMATFEYRTRYSPNQSPKPTPACPGPQAMTLTEMDFDLESPDYPNHLEPSMNCEWRLTRPPANHSLRYIHVTAMALPFPCDQSSTKLLIANSPPDGSKPLKVCGGKSSHVFPNDVIIRLEGGEDHLKPGVQFHVSYKELDYQKDCDKIYTMSRDSRVLNVTKTFIPGQFIAPFSCKLAFDSRDSGMLVSLSINFDDDQGCDRSDDSLAIYDGYDLTSPKLTPACTASTGRVQSTSNRLTMTLMIPEPVDRLVSFNLSVQTLESPDQAWHNNTRILYASQDDQNFTSPGYPLDYQTVKRPYREWQIRPMTNEQIEVEILDLRLEYTPNCTGDSLSVLDGPNPKSQLLGLICGRIEEKLTFRSSNKTLYIVFNTTDHPTPPVHRFKVAYYTRSSASPDVIEDKGRIYNGGASDSRQANNGDNDDNVKSRDDGGSVDKTTLIIIMVMVVCLLLIVVIVVVCLCKRRKETRTDKDEKSEEDSKESEPLHRTNGDKKGGENGSKDPIKGDTHDEDNGF